MILDLVSRWINFCETEHQSYCSLSIWVAMVTFEKTFYTNLNATPFYCRIQLFSSFKLFFLWTNIFQTFWKRKVHLPLYSDIKCIQWKDICIIGILSTVKSWPLTRLFCHFLFYSLSEILPLDNHSWLTCLAVLGSSISRSLCLTVRAYRAIIRVILACHFPKMFLFHHCFQDSARNKDMWEREDERSD